jgi:hypothetical protein
VNYKKKLFQARPGSAQPIETLILDATVVGPTCVNGNLCISLADMSLLIHPVMHRPTRSACSPTPLFNLQAHTSSKCCCALLLKGDLQTSMKHYPWQQPKAAPPMAVTRGGITHGRGSVPRRRHPWHQLEEGIK